MNDDTFIVLDNEQMQEQNQEINPRFTMRGYDQPKRKFIKKIKLFLYKTFNLMTELNNISETLYCILLVIELMQFFNFLFLEIEITNIAETSNPENEVVYFSPHQWLKYFDLQIVFLEFGSETMYIVFLCLVGVLLTTLWVMMVTIYLKCDDGFKALFTPSSFRYLIIICNFATVFLLKILFTPFLVVLLTPMFCESKASSGVWNPYLQTECWTPIHLSLTVIGFLFAVLMLCYCVVQSLIFNDPRATTKIPWACSQSKAEFIKTFMKCNMVIGLFVSQYESYALIIFQLVNILLCLLLAHQRYKYYFHSHLTVFYVTIVEEASLAWLSLTLTLLNLTLTAISPFDFAYLLVTLAIFDILAVLVFQHQVSQYSLTTLPRIKSEATFEQYFLKLHQYFAKQEIANLNKNILLGLVKNHMYECAEPDCQCQRVLFVLCENKLKDYFGEYFDFDSLDGPTDSEEINLIQDLKNEEKTSSYSQVQRKQKMILNNSKKNSLDEKFKSFLFQFFDSLLNKANAKLPRSMRLKFLHITLLQRELNNEFKSYFQILKLLKSKPSMEWEYYLYQSKQMVEQIMYKKYQELLINKQTLDCIKVFDFESHFLSFEKQIIHTAMNCLSFWKELMDHRLDVNRIHDFGVQISNSYTQVYSITMKMLSLFPNHLLLLKIYAFFLSDVMNNEQEALEYQAKAKGYIRNYHNSAIRNSKDEDKYFGYNTKTVIIAITVTQKDIGRIINANFETKQLLGYQNSEVKGTNVRILMPKILADNHDTFIKNYFETAKAKILEQQRIVFAKNKEGYLIPVTILIKAIPNLQRSLTFIGFLKRLDEDSEFLQPPSQFAGAEYHIVMCDSDGQIFGFTENCWETFGFKPSFFFNRFGDPEQMIRIEKIIKNLKDPAFLMKMDLKKEGQFCSLDTIQVMENVSRELLTKDEQEVLLNISGSYNINLQIEDHYFNNGKIKVKLYKILKLSRIIRSQNVFDMIHIKVEQYNESDAESNDLDRASSRHFIGSKFMFKERQDSLNQDDDLLVGSEKSKDSLYEDDHSISSIDMNSQSSQASTYIQTFKKTISRKQMPSSIKKLNRVVIGLVIMIVIVSILDLSQSVSFYNFVFQEEGNLISFFRKQLLLSSIGVNVLSLGLIKEGLQDNSFGNFTDRALLINQSLTNDIQKLQDIQQELENIDHGRFLFSKGNYLPEQQEVVIKVINEDGSIQEDSQSTKLSIYQYITRLQKLIFQEEMPEEILIREIYGIGSKAESSQLTESQKNMYYMIENSLFVLNEVNQQDVELFLQSLLEIDSKQQVAMVCIYVFFMVFVIISGLIVFPIVIGVQKNKVMILGIYFELPHSEIQRVYEKCLYFLSKIDIKFHGGRTNNQIFEMMLKNEADKNQPEERLKQEEDELTEEQKGGSESSSRNNQSKRDQVYSTRGQLPSSTRKMRQTIKTNQDSFLFGLHHQGSIMSKDETPEKDKKAIERNKRKGKMGGRTVKKQESMGMAQESDQSSQGKEEANDLDRREMFKKIKVKNKKVNIITLFLILCYLGYFSLSFSMKNLHTAEFETSFYTTASVFSVTPTLSNTFFFFLQTVMRNESLSVTVTSSDGSTKVVEPDGLAYYHQRIEELLKETEKIKVTLPTAVYGGAAEMFIGERDSYKFCDLINQNITYEEYWSQRLQTEGEFFQQQCFLIDNGEFQYGERNSMSNFLYDLKKLEIKFAANRNDFEALRELLNLPELVNFQIQLDVYYRSSFDMMITKAWDSISAYHSKDLLILIIEYCSFVGATLVIFSVLWRLFINDIRNEIYRSKGMLNMIPTNYLERDNNIKKLSINKLLMQ